VLRNRDILDRSEVITANITPVHGVVKRISDFGGREFGGPCFHRAGKPSIVLAITRL
jgi:hypothetical protein